MKAPRPARLAAAPLCCAALMSGTALAASASRAWSDLWRTPDQQAQALLDAGEAAQAAARFQDPRRRAYADLRAGHNAAAAKLLGPFKDPTSEYNLGNALARTGRLPGALAAYDAALKQTPADADIRHNRDLVERALRQLHAQPSSGNPRDGGHSSQHSGSGRRSGSGSQQHSGGDAQHAGAGGSQSGHSGSSGSQAGAGHSGNSGRQASPQASNGSGGSNHAAGQARRDAAFAAALARAQRQQGGTGKTGQGHGSQQNGGSNGASKAAEKGPTRGRLASGTTDLPRQKPESERQLALDQWLRQIPDSPAGLLRRKFMIQYMLKHPDASQEEPQ